MGRVGGVFGGRWGLVWVGLVDLRTGLALFGLESKTGFISLLGGGV